MRASCPRLKFAGILLSAVAPSGLDNNFGCLSVAYLARIDDNMILIMDPLNRRQVAVDLLLTVAVGPFDLFGSLFFT